MKLQFLLILTFAWVMVGEVWGKNTTENPVSELVERIDRGSSKNFIFEVTDSGSPEDFFEISTKRGKIAIGGNNWISVAAGLNWYLRYNAGVQITWVSPTAHLGNLPRPKKTERHSTSQLVRYYFDTRSASSTTTYWNTKRWQQEIDFMALHGVNTPLVTTGINFVWRETLRKAGYSPEAIQSFIPHPAYEGWWLDGKLEGWGGVTPDDYIDSRAKVGRWVVAECKRWGMNPTVMGYNGMMPSDSIGEKRESWHNLPSVSVIEATSESFKDIAKIYYEKLEELYGKCHYFYIDPSVQKVQNRATGEALFNAIPNGICVIPAWEKSPNEELIDFMPRGRVIVIDKWANAQPQWGDKSSAWVRKAGFLGHDWIFGAKFNFDGVSGLYGNISRLIGGYYLTKESGASLSMVGVGATMDGIGSNEIMYELLFELPWRKDKIDIKEWIDDYAAARYDRDSQSERELWQTLVNTIYTPEYNSLQRGASESVFAARPALEVKRVTPDGTTEIYYNKDKLVEALQLMARLAPLHEGNKNFTADMVAVGVQVLSNYGKGKLEEIRDAFNRGEKEKFDSLSNNFLEAMLLADNLLNSQRETMVGSYIESAMASGVTSWQRDWLRLGACTMITSWGARSVATDGERHDSAYRLLGGVVNDLYAKRWAKFFNYITENESLPIGYDYYDIEQEWMTGKIPYESSPIYDAALTVQEILEFIQRDN